MSSPNFMMFCIGSVLKNNKAISVGPKGNEIIDVPNSKLDSQTNPI